MLIHCQVIWLIAFRLERGLRLTKIKTMSFPTKCEERTCTASRLSFLLARSSIQPDFRRNDTIYMFFENSGFK